MGSVSTTLWTGDWISSSGYLSPHTQQYINRGNKGAEVPALLEACLQVNSLLCPLRILQALLKGLRRMGLGISVHYMNVVNTDSPILPEFKDQEVSLLFCGFWRRRVVLVGRTCGPGRLSLRLQKSGVVFLLHIFRGYMSLSCSFS